MCSLKLEDKNLSKCVSPFSRRIQHIPNVNTLCQGTDGKQLGQARVTRHGRSTHSRDKRTAPADAP